MLPSSLATFLQDADRAGSGSWLTSPEFRSAALGIIVTMGGFGLRLLYRVLRNVEKVCEDIHGTKERPGIFQLLKTQREEIDWLLDQRRAQTVRETERARLKREAIESAEREQWPHADRRHELRRDRDRVADVNQSAEFPIHPKEERRHE